MKPSTNSRPVLANLPRLLPGLLALGLAARLPAQTYTNLDDSTAPGNTGSVSGAAVTLSNTADSEYSGLLNTTGALTKTGTGVLTLTGTTRVGTTLGVDGGTLIFAQSATFATLVSGNNAIANVTADSGTLIFKDSSMGTFSGGIVVGRQGTGMLEITDYAKVSAVSVSMVNVTSTRATGTLKISGHGELTVVSTFGMSVNNLTAAPAVTATVEISDYGRMLFDNTTGNPIIGNGTQMTATFTVKDNGQFISRGNNGLFIGHNGATGYLNIMGSGSVQSTRSDIGNNNTAGSMGVVTVGGDAGLWNITAAFTVGSGSLIVNEHGTVNNTGASTVGTQASRKAHVVVGGSGLWQHLALTVGNVASGTGILEIKESGSVATVGAVNIGNNANANGLVIVNGSNALWTTSSGAFNVGVSGTGRMEISGGIVRTGTVTITSNAAGNGAVTLLGNATDGRGVLETHRIIRTGTNSNLIFDGGILRVLSANNSVIADNLTVTLLAGGAFIDTNGFDLTFNRGFTGTGLGGLNKQGNGTLTLTGTNLYTGITGVFGGTLVLPHSAAISSNFVTTGGDGVLVVGYGGNLTQSFLGTGGTVLLQHNHALTGDNSGYAGHWAVSSTVTAAGAQNIGDAASIDFSPAGLLDITNANPSGMTLGSRLNGTGTLAVALASSSAAFSLAATTGGDFQGVVALGASAFALAGDNTAALANATLRLGQGSVTTVGTGTQAINRLDMDGGMLVFSTSIPGDTISPAFVATSAFTINSGTIKANVGGGGGGISAPILEQDDDLGIKIISASTVSIGGQLALVGADGLPVSLSTGDIFTSGTRTAIGSYGYNVTTGAVNDGLYIGYNLTSMELLSGLTTVLSDTTGASGGATTLNASITGAGSLLVSAANTITLNAANSHTGLTTVASGTLVAAANDALGRTGTLAIAPGSGVVLADHTAQTIGRLDNQGALALNEAATLTLDAGGVGGVLTGTGGGIVVAGGTLSVTGANPALSGLATVIAPGASAIISNAASLGGGGYVEANGALTLNFAASGVFSNTIGGNGTIIKQASGTTTFASAGDAFSGLLRLDEGGLVATDAAAFGTGTVSAGAGLAVEYRGIAGGATQTRFAGDGTLVIRNSAFTLAGDSGIAHAQIEGSTLTLASVTALGGPAAAVTADAGSALHVAVDNAQLGALTLNGATLSLLRAPGSSFSPKTATLAGLAGSGGVIELNADFAENVVTADRLVINGPSSGEHTIRLNHTGDFFDDASGIWLVDAGSNGGTATFGIEGGAVDVGVSSYGFQQGDGSQPYPDAGRWYLAPTGLSNATDAILDTVAMIGADWYYNLDAFYLRMGDIRADAGGGAGRGGVWARAHGYQLNATNKLSGRAFDQRSFGVTAGIDKAFHGKSGSTVIGLMLDTGGIDRDFDNGGNGRTSNLTAGLYALWLSKSGWYADAVLKADFYKNKFDARAFDGRSTTGDYDSRAQGGSLELGKRFQYGDGAWSEFGAQAALASLPGETYETVSASANPIRVKVDGATAAQYRLQMRFGRRLGDGKWNPYFKIAGAYSEASGGVVHANDRSFKADYEGWRAETGAGLSYLVGKRSLLWLDYEYAKAASYSRPWSLSLGYRLAW
jgi:outer membrane autotransporter protein